MQSWRCDCASDSFPYHSLECRGKRRDGSGLCSGLERVLEEFNLTVTMPTICRTFEEHEERVLDVDVGSAGGVTKKAIRRWWSNA